MIFEHGEPPKSSKLPFIKSEKEKAFDKTNPIESRDGNNNFNYKAKSLVGLEAILEKAKIRTPLETVLSMDTKEFTKLRNSKKFTVTQTNALSLVRKQCKAYSKGVIKNLQKKANYCQKKQT